VRLCLRNEECYIWDRKERKVPLTSRGSDCSDLPLVAFQVDRDRLSLQALCSIQCENHSVYTSICLLESPTGSNRLVEGNC
jgi:hypothetical protein